MKSGSSQISRMKGEVLLGAFGQPKQTSMPTSAARIWSLMQTMRTWRHVLPGNWHLPWVSCRFSCASTLRIKKPTDPLHCKPWLHMSNIKRRGSLVQALTSQLQGFDRNLSEEMCVAGRAVAAGGAGRGASRRSSNSPEKLEAYSLRDPSLGPVPSSGLQLEQSSL